MKNPGFAVSFAVVIAEGAGDGSLTCISNKHCERLVFDDSDNGFVFDWR